MVERKDLRTSSRKGETRSWTQERKMSDDENRQLERQEKETQNWMQKVIEGKMSDDETRHLDT